jgi:hypothetical protein
MKLDAWKHHLVVFTMALLCIAFPVFLVTGYAALYWAWVRADLVAALPFLPWARNSGMLAMAASALALGILFSSKYFPDFTEDAPLAFAARHGHSRLLCRVQK